MKIVVLNDGETYSDLYGCVILDVPEAIAGDDLDEFIKENYESGVSLTWFVK